MQPFLRRGWQLIGRGRRHRWQPACVGAIAALTLTLGCSAKKDRSGENKSEGEPAGPTPPTTPGPATTALPPAPPLPPVPTGLPDLPSPADNPTTPEKVELGALLFFDPRLSDGGAFSCETCHLPEQGWADGKPLSQKHDGGVNKRHSPTLFNVAYLREWYWDGRKPTLESQILAAWTGQVGGTPEKVAARLAEVPGYQARFSRAFGAGPSPDNIPQALAAFVRALQSGGAPWDRYERGDKDAVSTDVIAGFRVFTEKANCALCHAPPLYMDTLYHNVGVGFRGTDAPDVGRFQVTQNPTETGAFKTPGLRGVTLHPPYFHDGSAATLAEAIDFMLAGGFREGNPHIDEKLRPAKLDDTERAQLAAFIEALTPAMPPFVRPTLP
jgi:cytochrome c peroxidase